MLHCTTQVRVVGMRINGAFQIPVEDRAGYEATNLIIRERGLFSYGDSNDNIVIILTFFSLAMQQ